MPHITIEHSKLASVEINLKELSQNLHSYLAEHETVNQKAIKTRTISSENVFIGEEQTVNKFIHITILLLAGRPDELKELIVKNIYIRTQKLINNYDYSLSVETRDLGTYFKG
jgi:5-carboxymethyl-2-hydroxymuconate isomerase